MRILIIVLLFMMFGCSAKNPNVLDIPKVDGTIDLSQIVKGHWDRVCIFSPYSDNDTAQKTLGFEWDLEHNSEIYHNDGISLLVFAADNVVVSHYEVSRYTDFSSFGGNCFSKESSIFELKSNEIMHNVKVYIKRQLTWPVGDNYLGRLI